MSSGSKARSSPHPDELVSDADYLQLSRLMTEHVLRGFFRPAGQWQTG